MVSYATTLVAGLALVVAAATGASRQPHIILLALDDIGWADVGYHGSAFPTPNIDALARSGVELDRMYAMPQCSPTRAALMTGRYSFHIGMQHWTTLMPGSAAGIPKDVPTIAERVKQLGYATHMIGKWHLGASKWSQTPTRRGFDTYLGYLQGQMDYYNHTIPACGAQLCFFKGDKGANSPYGVDGAGYDLWNGTEAATNLFGRYSTDLYMERAAEIFRAYKNDADQNTNPADKAPPKQPMFLYFAEQQLHVPLQLPPEPEHLAACEGVVGGSGLVNRTVLCAMASRLDASVGRLVELLQDNGMWNDTLIWAYSDNGGMTHWADAFPASASSNWPLRGGKTTTFEGGVRSVAFLAGGFLPAAARGTKVASLLHAVDVAPTLLRLAQGDDSPRPARVAAHTASPKGTAPTTAENPTLGGGGGAADLDGKDAWDYLTGTAGPHAPRFRTELPLQVAVNPLSPAGGVPHLPHPTDGQLNYSAIIVWPYKLIVGTPWVVAKGMPGDRDGWWTTGTNYTHIPVPPPRAARAAAAAAAAAAGPMLFNIETDEGEHDDLAASHPDLVANLTARLKDKWASAAHGYVKEQINIPHLLANPRLHHWTWAPFLPSWGDHEASTTL